MGHPAIDNVTPFAFEALFGVDEDGRPALTPILKSTWALGPNGELSLAEEQRPVDFAGVHAGEPGASSMLREPETAFTKLATDVVLVGHALAPRARSTEVQVSLRAGPIDKTVSVIGDRVWDTGLAGSRPTPPEPFERIPLVWEHAFGGWDRRDEDEERHDYEARNPIGRGFRARRSSVEAGDPLPNLEDPTDRIAHPGSRPCPMGFGFIAPDWQPRSTLAGTFDEAWQRSRSPMLPRDFDRRFFSAAPHDQIVRGFLPPGATVSITNVTPERSLGFRLPSLATPTALVTSRQEEDRVLALTFDTLIIDTDAMCIEIIWRGLTLLRNGPLDVGSIRIDCENAPASIRTQDEPSTVVPLFDERSASASRGA